MFIMPSTPKIYPESVPKNVTSGLDLLRCFGPTHQIESQLLIVFPGHFLDKFLGYLALFGEYFKVLTQRFLAMITVHGPFLGSKMETVLGPS